MSSKTARASAVKEKFEKQVIPDAELIRLLRIDRASGIYPGVQGTDAVLRALDAQTLLLAEKQIALDVLEGEKRDALATLNSHLTGRKEQGGYTDLDDAMRQLLQAFISNRDLVAELTSEKSTPAVELPPTEEPGLTPAAQGTDSLGL